MTHYPIGTTWETVYNHFEVLSQDYRSQDGETWPSHEVKVTSKTRSGFSCHSIHHMSFKKIKKQLLYKNTTNIYIPEFSLFPEELFIL